MYINWIRLLQNNIITGFEAKHVKVIKFESVTSLLAEGLPLIVES
jgi:hypothetical protein